MSAIETYVQSDVPLCSSTTFQSQGRSPGPLWRSVRIGFRDQKRDHMTDASILSGCNVNKQDPVHPYLNRALKFRYSPNNSDTMSESRCDW